MFKFKVTIRKKLMLAFGVILLFLIILGVVNTFYIIKFFTLHNRTTEDLFLSVFLEKMLVKYQESYNTLYQQLITNKISNQEIDYFNSEFWNWYEKFKSDNPKIMEIYLAIREPYQKFYSLTKMVRDLYSKGEKDQAIGLYTKEIIPLAKEVYIKISRLSDTLRMEAENYQKTMILLAKRLKVIVMGIIILGVVIGLGIAFFVTDGIVYSLRLVLSRIEEIANAAGDLSVTVPVRTNDEFGMFAKAFNQMLVGLRTLIVQVWGTSERVSATSSQLSSAIEQINASLQGISTSIQQITKGISLQAKKMEESSTIVEKMVASVKQITGNANEGAKASHETTQLAQQGVNDSIEAVDKTMRISEVSNEIAQIVGKLGERSQEIGRIVEVITNIADQTNLLALNAAIEAARAGETGRGFAVVAEEVRKLAENSAQAAEQIGSLIRTIQQETSQAVNSVKVTSQEIEEGRLIINKMRQALDKILKSAETTALRVEQIAVASEVQIVNAGEVNKTITEVASISEGSAASVEEVSSSIQEMTASMEEIASSAQELANTAANLQELIKRFKV
ncbi:MAG: methyl-accepting chemotaxis protein [Candidatus Omnitrophica bacterium]|nr:methyl-accepting chemotaxis protein [Candidatus Omnitrophota bacterium]MCM8826205.1 methyl-accepting chemotaxis protein [Candidatus Omnitrophota bacterium]